MDINQIKKQVLKINSKSDIDFFLDLIEKNLSYFSDDDLQDLFFNYLALLHQNLFDRTAIPNNTQARLRKLIDKRIPDIEKDFINASDEYKTLHRNAMYYASIGSLEKPEKGASSSYKVIDPYTKKTLGIYKPSSGESYSEEDINLFQMILRQFIKFLFRSIDSRNLEQTVSGKGFVAEVVSNLVSQKLVDIIHKSTSVLPEELNLKSFVPETQITGFDILPSRKKTKGKTKGSFQLWINAQNSNQKIQEAMSFFETDKRYNQKGKEAEKTLSPELFDMMVIISYITGDADKKGDNWLIISEDGKATGVQLIDGGWSMHPFHIESSLATELNYQHCWKILPNGKVTFSDLGKQVILGLRQDPEGLISQIRELYKKIGEEPEMTENRIKLMLARMEVLNYAVVKGLTLEELADIRRLKDYKKVHEILDDTSIKNVLFEEEKNSDQNLDQDKKPQSHFKKPIKTPNHNQTASNGKKAPVKR
jgi:hypothetical protein